MTTSPRSDEALEFGVFDWVDAQGDRDPADVFADRLALVRRADEGAFSRYHVAEHHGTPLGLAASPALLLAAAARETDHLLLVPTTFILPLYEPLRLAEEIGMLDRLSRGRLEIGVGKGSSPHEAAMFGVDSETAAARYAERYPAIFDALRTGVFRPADGDPVPLFIRPASAPDIWYPTGNPDSVRRAAAQGQHTIFGFGFRSPGIEAIREGVVEYFRVAAESTLHPVASRARFGILRHVLVADSDEEAMDAATAAFRDHFDSFSHLWRVSADERFTTMPDLRDLVARHLFFVGSPASVAEQIGHVVRETGINYVAGAFAWGSLTHERALHSLDLFDREVIPTVRAQAGG